MVKNPTTSAGDAGDLGLIPGSGRYCRAGSGNPFKCSCLENFMNRGPGGLQTMGSQRLGHECAHTHTHVPSYGDVQLSDTRRFRLLTSWLGLNHL